MNPFLRRIAITLLCVYIFCASVFGHSASHPNENGGAKHYLIVTDLTGETRSDEICHSLTELLTDLLPLENTQVSLIGYGYQDPKTDAFSFDPGTHVAEAAYVHEITPPEISAELPPEEYRDALIRELRSISARSNRRSPHGHALLASMQYLRRANTEDADACVILISDGERASDQPEIDNDCKAEALEIAREHCWPIYTIELDPEGDHVPLSEDAVYDDLDCRNAKKRAYPRKFMTEVAWKSGARRQDPANSGSTLPGTWVIGPTADSEASLDLHQSHQAALEILGFRSETKGFASSDVLEFSFAVPNLTCEYLFYLQDTALEDISVVSVTEGTEMPVNPVMLRTVSGDSCSVIRLLCPTPGDYILRVLGEPGRQLLTGSRIVAAPELKLTFLNEQAEPIQHDETGTLLLPEGEFLCVRAECWYGENCLSLSSDDKTYTARLKLLRDTKNQTIYPYECHHKENMDPGNTAWISGYHDPSSVDVPPEENTGCYLVQVTLLHTQTDTALLSSGQVPLTTVPAKAAPSDDAEIIELGQIEANSSTEISLEGKLEDMPKGSLEFTLIGTDGAGEDFHLLDSDGEKAANLTGPYTTLKLQTNSCIGEYNNVSLRAASYGSNKSFMLHFEVIPPSLEAEDLELELYDRAPNRFTKWIKNWKLSDPLSWSVPVALSDISGYDEQVIQFETAPGTGLITGVRAKAPGETKATVTLNTGTCKLDGNGKLVPVHEECTIHVVVKSMANPERRYTVYSMIGVVIAIIVLLALIYWLFCTGCNVSCTFSVNVENADPAEISLTEKKNLKELLQPYTPANPSPQAGPNNDGIRKMKHCLDKLETVSLRPFRFLPLLITGIPRESGVTINGNVPKRSCALVSSTIAIGIDSDITLTIHKNPKTK